MSPQRKTQVVYRRIVVFAAALAVLTATAWAQAPAQLTVLLQQHYDAVNRGDVAAVMATFADDAVFVRGSACPLAAPCVGKARFQPQVEREVRNQVRFTPGNIHVSGTTVTARVEFRGVPVQAAGVERAIYNATVTFRGDRISRVVHELDLSDSQTASFENYLRVRRVVNLVTDAISRGDVAGVMRQFADDATFEGWGLCAPSPCVGRMAIQKEVEHQMADNTRIIDLPGARVSGNTSTGRNEIRSNSLRAAGTERVIISLTAETEGEKIKHLRYAREGVGPFGRP